MIIMASSGRVTLNGRFSAGTHVSLWKVRDETVLRHEGGDLIDTKKVDDDGRVQFTKGVETGARYLIYGINDGVPLSIRARGRSADDDSEVLAQPPIGPDRVRLANGEWADEAPKRVKAPGSEVGPAPAQNQVPAGTPQRSDTPLGQATPVDPKELAPYPPQEDVKKGTEQRSDTERGQATPVPRLVPDSQSDVKAGTWQRSDTPRGVATPIPKGDAIEAQRVKEAADTKAAIGEPVKAAAQPEVATTSTAKSLPGKASSPDEPVAPVPDEGDNTSGLDAQGQPVAADVAAVAGVEPADSPAEPVKKTRKK